MIVSCDDEIGVIIVYMSDCHSVRASKMILLLVFTVVLIICAYASAMQSAGHGIVVGGCGNELRARLIALYKREGWLSWACKNSNDQ